MICNRASPQFNIRLPLELKNWIVDESQKDDRSMNTFLVRLIEKAKAESEAEEKGKDE